MRGFLIGVAKSFTRISWQARKEIIQVRRRPVAFISLVLGPFLLMAVFGLGFTGIRSPLTAALVLPQELDLPREPEFYESLSGQALAVTGITEDEATAMADLQAGRVDVVVIAPADAVQQVRTGQAATIRVAINEVDPAMDAYARIIAREVSQEVNRQIITRAVEEGEEFALRRIEDGSITSIPPEVLAAPTTAVTENYAPTTPGIATYFSPAVLALVLQHMAVTLSALSLVRERLSGTMDLFRVSPIGPTELLLGKYLGFGLVAAAAAAALIALMVGVLGVPILGPPAALVLIVVLMVVASLGVGLLISVVSDSERQAVQLSMLVLLASVFFSGIVLRVEDFRPEVQLVSYALPVTHGIQLLQELMLRGTWELDLNIVVLSISSLVLLLLSSFLLRRDLKGAARR